MGRKLDDMSPEELRRTIAAGGLRRDRREEAERLLAIHEGGRAEKGQDGREDRAEEALRISRNANRIALAAVAVAVVALLVSYFDGP